MLGEILDKHIAKNFYISNTADNLDEKLLSTNPFMDPNEEFIQYQTSRAINGERVATKL